MLGLKSLTYITKPLQFHFTNCLNLLSKSCMSIKTVCVHLSTRIHRIPSLPAGEVLKRKFSNASLVPRLSNVDASDDSTFSTLSGCMLIYEDFISEEEEIDLLNEIEPYVKKMRYEYDHWDNAIHGYRETERRNWTKNNKKIIQRIRDIAFPPGVAQLAYVHILDLHKDGFIKPHIDSVRFCGDTIAGVSLLSSSVMALVHEDDESKWAKFLLNRRSLYIMKESARYDYKHELYGHDKSSFKSQAVTRDRRIAVICRNEVPKES